MKENKEILFGLEMKVSLKLTNYTLQADYPDYL
jgi:hypothetical protein